MRRRCDLGLDPLRALRRGLDLRLDAARELVDPLSQPLDPLVDSSLALGRFLPFAFEGPDQPFARRFDAAHGRRKLQALLPEELPPERFVFVDAPDE
ncbi:MAG: hypothetical protein RMK01_01425 [Thermomicrobium sp.]|nr:hypothetical protein [Thermomicrobium sp.]MDW8058715.1 hypothetical protein [Thermomicrobium sp.]